MLPHIVAKNAIKAQSLVRHQYQILSMPTSETRETSAVEASADRMTGVPTSVAPPSRASITYLYKADFDGILDVVFTGSDLEIHRV
jgi:hypothetical protein